MTYDIDRLLEGAGPTPGARPRYDLEAGRRYVAEKQAARRVAPTAAPRLGAPGPASPVSATLGNSLLDDASRDLLALAKLVINEPGADALGPVPSS
ncbi:hypothetical protein C7C46_23730, partial [Streptomyces tateyamensis]